jgi:signal transduction histidine kinase
MLKTLMDISEAETGVMKLSRERVDLAALLEDATELYRMVAEEKSVGLSLSLAPKLTAEGDRGRLRQVFANILDNAVKYTPSGGRVSIEASERDGGVVVSVSDTGPGIPPEELPHIWERLYRGDKSRSQPGLGLGLSLVRAVLKAHGGSVEAVSEPGAGSRFTVFLPAPSNLSNL